MKEYAELLQEARERGYNIGACVKISNKNGDILLIKRATGDFYQGIWELPGGGLDKDEDPKVAAAREVWEETGLFLQGNGLRYETYFEFHNVETNKTKRKFVFSAQAEGEVTVSHEHSQFCWLSKQEVESLKRQSEYADYEIWDDHRDAIMLSAAV